MPKGTEFHFDGPEFKQAAETRIPGLYALATPDGVLCARRGGVWYTPRGDEAAACKSALQTGAS